VRGEKGEVMWERQARSERRTCRVERASQARHAPRCNFAPITSHFSPLTSHSPIFASMAFQHHKTRPGPHIRHH